MRRLTTNFPKLFGAADIDTNGSMSFNMKEKLLVDKNNHLVEIFEVN